MHSYHWTKTLTAENCYTITWYDGQSSLCQTETKIIGPQAEVETALGLAAEQLRKENSALFPEETEETGEISTQSTTEEEVYG